MKERQITIGKDPSNHIQLSGKYVDDFHAIIHVKENEVILEDLGSRFGTIVNHQKIEKPTLINDHSYIDIGYSILHLKDIIEPEVEEQNIYLKDLFSFRGTIDRGNYRYLFLLFCLSPLFIFLGVPAILKLLERTRGFRRGFSHSIRPLEYLNEAWLITSLVVIYIIVIVSVKRLRSIRKPWYNLLVPGYNLFLLLFRK